LGLPVLYPLQTELIRSLEKYVLENEGGVIAIRSARQTTKNEASATIQLRMLYHYISRGGIYIRTAPTWKPQIVISKRRFEMMYRRDPLVKDRIQKHEGYIYQLGNAEIQFLSSSPTANVTGSTASIALDMDEAQNLDDGKFEREFKPMTAFKNVPILLFGVAGDKTDVLYKYRGEILAGQRTGMAFDLPAAAWCEFNEDYRKHYESEVAVKGHDHIWIKTQYDLEDVDAMAAFLNERQRDSILSGTHERMTSPASGHYVFLIDVGGEDQFDRDDETVRVDNPVQDSTACMIFERILAPEAVFPTYLLRDIYWRTGASHETLRTELKDLTLKWKPHDLVVDARGIGYGLASFLFTIHRGTNKYQATQETVSEDCYDFMSRVNCNTVKCFQSDNTPEYGEFKTQLSHTEYEYSKGKIKIMKPGTGKHIDMLKACTYLNQLSTRRGGYFVAS